MTENDNGDTPANVRLKRTIANEELRKRQESAHDIAKEMISELSRGHLIPPPKHTVPPWVDRGLRRGVVLIITGALLGIGGWLVRDCQAQVDKQHQTKP
jgi:hypothetical protein